MQNRKIKYLIIFCLFFPGLPQPIYSQVNKYDFILADSLFKEKQFTRALTLYEKILNTEERQSPKMILKMAFIKEGLNDYTSAMYYLHLYYSQSPNRAVLRKMEELAKAHRLTGYEYSDLHFFQTQFHKYYLTILEGMLFVAVLMVCWIVIRRKKRKVSDEFKIAFSLYLVFMLYYINYLDFGQEGIISNNKIPIMSAPSAGSNWLTTASKGHKIPINGEDDIWYKIEWNNKEAYVRKQNIILLP